MANYKKIAVCLDLTDMDPVLIRYTTYIAHVLKAESVTFLHVVQTYDLNGEAKSNYPKLNESIKQVVSNELENHIHKDSKPGFKTDLAIKFEEKDASEVILEYIQRKKIDLTVIGKKPGEQRKGFYAGRIIRAAHSDILLVPKSAETKMDWILTILDYSKHAKRAFRLALDMAQNTDARLTSQYIFRPPKNYFPMTQEDSDEKRKYLEKTGKKKQKKFLRKMGYPKIPISYNFETRDYTDQADIINEQAEKFKADLMILGAAGSVSSTATLLGNISDELHKLRSPVPVMIMKNIRDKNLWNQIFGE